MATDVGTVRGPAAKYDAFVVEQLARANQRIRTLDLAAAVLGFAAGTLLYVVAVVVCDSKLDLAPRTRQLALLLYLAGAAVYLAFTVVRPLRRRINPYYAAGKVEATVPGAKNSVINWVDLHDQPLPPAVRGALGQRAARDLRQADVERAISGRRTGWAGGLLTAACVAFAFAYFALGPKPFLSLLGRALAPLRAGEGIATRTRLTLVRPAGGDATVTVNRPVTIAVEAEGKVPAPKDADAIRLQYRYDETEPYQERLLQPETGREFSLVFPAAEVRNGFWYRVAGGDVVTPEYRVRVRAAPFLTDFQATYHYRPYVARLKEVNTKRELEALRGTRVVLLARTNRQVKEAHLVWESGGQPDVPGQRLAADPQSFQVELEMKADGRYRLRFVSAEDETYQDAAAYTVTVIPDSSPEVEITKPAQNVRLPADGVLTVEGKASDDIGVKSVLLRGKVIGGPKLQAKPYRSDDKMRLADGGYPREVDYKDFLDLGKVQGEDGKGVALKAGMVVEYWLEAGDACDYDRPNVTQSKHYKIEILDPEKNAAKQQEERKKAEQEKKQQEQKQDAKQQAENKQRQEERKQQQAENEKAKDGTDNKQNGPGEGKDNPKKEEKPGGDGKKPEDKPGGKDNPNQKDNPEQKGNPDQKEGPERDLTPQQKEQKQRLEDALKRQQQQEQGDGKGESKSDKQQGPGEAKEGKQEDGPQKPGDKGEGQPKDAGMKDGAKDAGAGKEPGKEQAQPGADKKPGTSKDEGRADPMNGAKGEGKDEKKQAGAAQEAKADAKPKGAEGNKPQNAEGGQDKRSEGKPTGKPEQAKGAAQEKPEGKNSDKGSPKADNKEDSAGAKKPEDRQAAGEKKDNPGEAKCECKGGGNNPSAKAGSAKEGASNGGKPGSDGAMAAGNAKPSSEGKGGQQGARAEAKPEGGEPKNGKGAQDATAEDVRRLAKQLDGADQKGRQGAAEQLEQIRDQAKDGQARADAGEALKKAGLDGGGEAKPAPEKKPGGDEPKPGKGDGSAGSGKAGGDNKPDAKQGDNKPDGQGDKKPAEAKPQGPGKAEGPGKTPAGNDPGQGAESNRTDTDRPPAGDPKGPKGKPSPPEAARAATLQLEDFKKRVDKNVLKDAKMSEEDYREFLRAYEDALRQYKEKAERPERTPDARQPAPLRSFGGNRDKPRESGAGELEGENRALPPGPYRDAYQKFTRQLSQPAGGKK